MNDESIDSSLENTLEHYKKAFSAKVFNDESSDEDDLMLVFGLTQEIKSKHGQYWGKQLGHCWEKITAKLCKQKCENFGDRIKYGSGRKHLCDFVIGDTAVDAKYRIGSGDQGTLNKFVLYGKELQSKSYKPVMLILRNDNLPPAINACKKGGWEVKSGEDTYKYILEITGFDLQSWLKMKRNSYKLGNV